MVNYSVDTLHDITIPVGNVNLNGILLVPKDAKGIILFAHGSGSGRLSVRNQYVAGVLQEANLGTLLFDLLTHDEESIDDITRELRFNIEFLASRLTAVTEWTKELPLTSSLAIGYFGASTGGAAALVAAAEDPTIKAVVSRGGRPDLAGNALPNVKAPTLLIVGGNDEAVIKLNQEALSKLSCIKELKIVPGATHLFEEPGTLEQVAELASEWFLSHV